MMKFLTVILSLWIISAPAWATTTQQLSANHIAADSLTKAQNKAIMLDPKAKEFTIKLASNPTTGYSWYLAQYDKTLFQLQSRTYIPSKQGQPGAGGYEVWRFNIQPTAFIAPRISTIEFTYVRPWDLASKTTHSVTVVTQSIK